ncbi:MAG: DUF1499 domain-containing protein [Vicinamibacterales bacterium]
MLLLVPVALLLGLVALALLVAGLVAARRRRSAPELRRAGLGLLIVLVVLGIPIVTLLSARGAPVIHDVTTDTADPPPFVAVLRHREGALNPVDYGGPDVAARQRQAYPDLAPLHLDMPPDQAFDRALAAVHDMGWDLVAADRSAGRIEATDTTIWFGFKDDVVVRVRRDDGGSRIDVRSLSRVGGGDLGTNAKRVLAYLRRLGP